MSTLFKVVIVLLLGVIAVDALIDLPTTVVVYSDDFEGNLLIEWGLGLLLTCVVAFVVVGVLLGTLSLIAVVAGVVIAALVFAGLSLTWPFVLGVLILYWLLKDSPSAA
jgi:hypothetical protein